MEKGEVARLFAFYTWGFQDGFLGRLADSGETCLPEQDYVYRQGFQAGRLLRIEMGRGQ